MLPVSSTSYVADNPSSSTRKPKNERDVFRKNSQIHVQELFLPKSVSVKR